MQTLFLGVFVIVAVILASVVDEGTSYFVAHSTILVMGGSVGVLFFSTPSSVFLALVKSINGVFKSEPKMQYYKNDLDALAQNKYSDVQTKHAIVDYAKELWDKGVDHDLFAKLLQQKKREIDLKSMDAVQALKNLAKYPPALGMIGTVIGMIALFNNLDKNRDMIGQNLSIAMTATFLGLILANLVISPLADRLQIQYAKNQQINSHLCDILLLINQGEPASLVAEEINGRAA